MCGFRIPVLVAMVLLSAVVVKTENTGGEIEEKSIKKSLKTKNATSLIDKVEEGRVEGTGPTKIRTTDKEEVDAADVADTGEMNARKMQETVTGEVKTTNTGETGAIGEQKAGTQEAVSGVADDDDLFTLEHLGLEIPVKSAVETLNMDVLKQMLLKKLTAKFGKYAKSKGRKKRTS
ncbi:hypothetical protein LOAG_00174 [Loa loa]|uniref:Uncharacterized protein n=1 Tax=Loa loa TaxID=7209 RepID=A0A1I7VLQ7_LOALO|nr:hypothetical protein LOAG_00174 [Loa loa]EFO28317.2 hypothetical protein LOAG_00174 [Loa loa]